MQEKKQQVDRLVKNASIILTMDENFRCLQNASLAITDSKIVWIGPDNEAKKKFVGRAITDVAGGIITPGLIDCHTHTIFSKTRENEYLAKLAGKDYVEILSEGGGINASANHLRNMGVQDLVKQGIFWLNEFLKYGVTCVEIKTGYGLDYISERKMLEAICIIKNKVKQIIIPTFLAHIIPQEYIGKKQQYIALIKTKMLPDFRQYTDNFDIFIEKGAFSYAQADELIHEAKRLNYNIKIHTNQINRLGGITLAKKYRALSVDHLDTVKSNEVKTLAASGAVAVLLPGASYFTQSKCIPPTELFKRYNIPIAISTDFNPGTCPSPNLHLMMSMAVHRFNMTLQDVWQAVTINAARALLLDKTVGSLELGKLAHLVYWKMPNYIYPFYHFGMNFVEDTWIG